MVAISRQKLAAALTDASGQAWTRLLPTDTPGAALNAAGSRVVLVVPPTSTNPPSSDNLAREWLHGVLTVATGAAATTHWPHAGADPRPPAVLDTAGAFDAGALAELALLAAQAAKATDIDQAVIVQGANQWPVVVRLIHLLLLALEKPAMAGASKPSKLHARIAAAADVLGSLTTTTTTTTTGTTTTSMHMGLAWELHLDTNHRAVAAQVLDYCIDAARLARSSEAPALVRGLVAAASHDQLRAWNLSDSITTVNGSAADTKLGTKLRKALTKLGLSRTSQDALASAFVAVVMHLSAGNVSSCAALLGVDAPALTASLATHPGGAVGAAATLYRALVAWVLEFVNTRLSAPEGADPPVAVVSVVAMPDTAAPAGGLDFGATLAHRARLHLDRIQSNAVRAVYTQLLDDEIAPARMAGKFDLTDPPGIATTRSVRRAFPDEDQAGTVHTALAAVLGSSSLLVVREAAAMVADMADTAPPAVAAAAATASAASLGVPTMRRTPSMKKRPAAASGGDSPKLPGVSGSLVRDLDADMASLAIALEDANVFSVFTSPVAGLDGSTDPHAAHVAAAATTFPRHGALTVRVPLTKFASRYAGVASTLLRIPATAARPPSDLTELVLAAVGDTDRIVTNGAPSGEDAVWVSARGLRLAEGAVSVYREWKRAMRQSSASIGGVSVYSAVAPISPAQLHAYPMPMAPVSPFSPPPHSAYGPPPPMSFDDAASVATTDYYDDDDMSDTVSVYDSFVAEKGRRPRAPVPPMPQSPFGRSGSDLDAKSSRARSVISRSSSSSGSGGGAAAPNMPPVPPPAFTASSLIAAGWTPPGAPEKDTASIAGMSIRSSMPAGRSGQQQQQQQRNLPPSSQTTLMGGASTVSSSSSTPPPAASQQPKATPTRRRWLFFTWLITFWVPPFMMGICCGLKDRAAQMAWREKVAICFVIFVMSGAMLFAIVFAGVVVCPPRNLFSFNELGFMSTPDTASAGTAKKWYAAVHGRVYNLYDLSITSPDSHPTSRLRGLLSYDLSAGFPRNPSLYCGSLSPDATMTAVPEKVPDKLFGIDVLTGHNKTKDGNLDNKINSYLLANSRGFLAISKADVETSWNPKNKNDMTRKRIIVSGVVYDLTNYYLLPRDKQFLGNAMFKLATGEVRRADDYMALTATTSSVDLSADDEFMAKVWNSNGGFRSCMDALFAEAVVDERQSIKCLAADWVLFGMSVVMFSVIGIKFLAALLLPRAQFVPEKMDRFVMLQVPAYTEDETSMRKTLNSLANLNYDDKHKLIVVLCDGMIVGRGNDRPTPHIVLDILGVDPSAYDEAPLLSYESVGDGPGLLTNMARVYSGLYEVEGRLVPYLVIAKCGKAGEISRPGNRGKRDSQMILMRFLNKVHTGKPMSPLECELQWHIERLIGIDPKWYEFMLMVDADTTVDPEALSQLVAFSLTDTRLVGVCGETRLSNEKKSFTTMIQVYEYFISHHLSKAFESIFGSVTCLPGCFCMYRIFSSGPKPKPLLVHDKVVDAYADTNVDTLHKKNLLALGEDRYLTTLVLSTFPSMKTKFTPAAMAYTAAPESISVLLSQRRRWINSTIHNLLELMRVQALCAFCCFSMRFVVLLDLVATLVQPAMVVYLGYLVFLTVRAIQLEQSLNLVMVSFLMLAAVYGAQAFVFLMKREFAHIMWMFIYLLALPIFGFFIPLYSFWCMDTFSWGNTRSLAKGADQGGASGAHDDLSAELCPPPTDDPRDLPQWTFAEYVARRGQFADAVDRHVAHAAATAAAAAAAAKPVDIYVAGSRGVGGAPSINGSTHDPWTNNDDLDDSRSQRSVAMSSRSWHDRAVPVPSPVTLLPPGLGSGSPRGSYMAPSPRASYIGAPVPSSRESMYATGVSIPGIGGGGSPHHRNNSPGIAMQPLHAVSPSGVPTEEQLTAEICRILEASDLMQVTKRGVRAELESLFGVDLAPQRAFINATIDRVLQVMAQDS